MPFKDREEIIFMPYSFYSKDGHEKIIDELNKMGYAVCKTYPDEKVVKKNAR